MNAPRDIPDIVIERQTGASDPDSSAWVSANAGSGKTHVLAQRVIRLLLDGVDPARILCITFTKAAAANMANKVFKDLRAWTALDDKALDAAIVRTGVRTISAALRIRARQLFALALETPGGLKVQTIHAFCTQLLHLFPFEANVPARFDVLDDVTETQMLHKLTLDVLLDASQAPDSALGRALSIAVLAAADQTFQDMVRAAIRRRDDLIKWVEAAGGLEQAFALMSGELDVKPDETVASVDTEMFRDSRIAESEWASVGAIMLGGSKTDIGQGQNFIALAGLEKTQRIEAYIDIFCTGKRDKARERIATSAIQKIDPPLCEKLNAERDRVWKLVQRKRAIQSRDRSVALFTIAYAVIVRFGAEKNRRGLLDYEDLIDKTLDLLTEDSAAWVHYKLDRGIHHVLIDEAQDTSPKQWDIVKRLVSEFFAGKGAHERLRTIFAVGDEKQSIFSFQGAAPREFAAMRRHFEQTHARAGLKFFTTEFKHSFRSGPNVLGAVDVVFSNAEAFAGLSDDPVAPVHESLPDAAPGLVEIWELEEPDTIEKKPGWKAPFDLQTATSGAVKLARRVAGTVAELTRQGHRPKDVLILVRQRGAFFEAVIRALKHEKIAVAGADRLVLTQHIAVMDLMVLADSVLLPQDDLALATLLKSPLFGLDDDALFKIAWGRKGSLYASLQALEPELAVRFETMRENARTLSPFDFYAWLLGAERGRRQFLMRLGHEAADALDEFLNLALDFERRQTPSLQGFVAWMRAAEAEVKRDMEMDRDEVRVMTVHGAKGLEAPIVILADTTTPPEGSHPPKLLTLPAGPMIWSAGGKINDIGPMAAARTRELQEASDEYRRLLYVAMTRAAERLIVCGSKGAKEIPQGCWYLLVKTALADQSVSEIADFGGVEVLRFRKTAAAAAPHTSSIKVTAPAVEMPLWLSTDAPREQFAARNVTPSGLLEDDERPVATGGGNEQGLLRGKLLHRLMQSLPSLPSDARLKASQDYLARSELPPAEQPKLAAQVMAVLNDPRFAELFGPGSRAEVPIVGRLKTAGQTLLVSGQVDRLVITDAFVLIGDFKTNRPPPRMLADVPPQYVRQLALYRAVLAKLYPDRPIRAALIWTEVPDLMELSAEALDNALARITSAR